MPALAEAPPAGRLAKSVAELFPGYFALVMATGILSIAGHLLGWPRLARALFYVNLPAYTALAARTVARLQTELGLPTQIGIPLLFEFPTVSKLAAELGRLRQDPQPDDALLARIAELSDEEVDRMLMDDSVESLQGLQANP